MEYKDTIFLPKSSFEMRANDTQTSANKFSLSALCGYETIAKEIYGADGVEYSNLAEKNLKTISNLELDHLPVCIAKTQKSLSDDPKLIGRPEGFIIHIREIEIASGAGFLIPISGDMMRMPGLPAHPASENINIDNDGNITGLF